MSRNKNNISLIDILAFHVIHIEVALSFKDITKYSSGSSRSPVYPIVCSVCGNIWTEGQTATRSESCVQEVIMLVYYSKNPQSTSRTQPYNPVKYKQDNIM